MANRSRFEIGPYRLLINVKYTCIYRLLEYIYDYNEIALIECEFARLKLDINIASKQPFTSVVNLHNMQVAFVVSSSTRLRGAIDCGV